MDSSLAWASKSCTCSCIIYVTKFEIKLRVDNKGVNGLDWAGFEIFSGFLGGSKLAHRVLSWVQVSPGFNLVSRFGSVLTGLINYMLCKNIFEHT